MTTEVLAAAEYGPLAVCGRVYARPMSMASYQAGRLARAHGVALLDNPNIRGTHHWRMWRNGWNVEDTLATEPLLMRNPPSKWSGL